MITLELFGIGVVVGFLGALLGIGGGVLLVPFLVLIIHVPIHQAVATSLITIIATSSQVASFGLRQKLTNLRLAFLLNLSSATGAAISSFVATRVEEKAIELVFSFILLIIAGLMLVRDKIMRTNITNGEAGYFGGVYYDPALKRQIQYRPNNIPAAFGMVLISGMIAGVAGTSGGIFNVPILNLVCSVPIKVATMTSSLMIGVTACAGALVYFRHDLIMPLLVGPIVLGVLGGTAVGTRLAVRLKSKWLVRIFALLLVSVAVKMILR